MPLDVVHSIELHMQQTSYYAMGSVHITREGRWVISFWSKRDQRGPVRNILMKENMDIVRIFSKQERKGEPY